MSGGSITALGSTEKADGDGPSTFLDGRSSSPESNRKRAPNTGTIASSIA